MVREETDEETNNLKTRQCMPDRWKLMSDASKRKAKQKWTIEKPMFDNARRLGHHEKTLVEVRNSDVSGNALQNTNKQW